jgi:4-amino-4-deoxy-L-arabinose transferase-like glycosyltransferase
MALKKTSKKFSILAVGLPILAYVLLAGHSIYLPGPYYDEVLQSVVAIAAMRGGMDGQFPQVAGSVISIGGYSLPILILPYLGSLQAQILLLVYWVVGINVPVMRATFITLGIVPLLFTYLFAKRFFDFPTAFLAAFFLALDPTYIFSARSDNGPALVMLICKMGALYFFTLWWQKSRFAGLIFGAFLCGVGLYDKLNFAWFIVACALAIWIFYGREAWQKAAALKRGKILIPLAFFCLGAAPQIAYQVLTKGKFLRNLPALLTNQTPFGIDNANFLPNLIYRMKSLWGLLGGYELLDFYTTSFNGHHFEYEKGFLAHPSLQWLFIFTLILLVIQLITKKWQPFNSRKLLFLFFCTLFIVLFSAFTPTNFVYHHLLVVYPFPHLIAAYGLTRLPGMLKLLRFKVPSLQVEINAVRSLVGSVSILALLTSTATVFTYYRALEKSGGTGMWSDAIYELSAYLDGDDRTVVLMDWGLSLNLIFLSKGELRTEEVWRDFLYSNVRSPEMEKLIQEPGRVFVFHTSRYAGINEITTHDGPRSTFFQTVESLEKIAVLEKQFYQRDGDPIYDLYVVK